MVLNHGAKFAALKTLNCIECLDAETVALVRSAFHFKASKGKQGACATLVSASANSKRGGETQ
jgi:hypothetical protein